MKNIVRRFVFSVFSKIIAIWIWNSHIELWVMVVFSVLNYFGCSHLLCNLFFFVFHSDWSLSWRVVWVLIKYYHRFCLFFIMKPQITENSNIIRQNGSEEMVVRKCNNKKNHLLKLNACTYATKIREKI